MKLANRILSGLLTGAMLVGMLPASALAAPMGAGVTDSDQYSIQNDVMKYSVNTKTGGFSVETLEGHPQKDLDNDMPLLYRDDLEDSPNTSFTTVRIDGEDYVFGRAYGFWGIDTTLGTPIVADDGRSLSVTWTIKGYVITQTAALSIDMAEAQTGSIGLAYSVENTNATEGNVSIRVLLDTALGNNVDAPYLTPFQVGHDSLATQEAVITTERVYTTQLPNQIRGVDSQTKPTKASYLILNEAVGTALAPTKLAVGHWANLANTTYDFNPDTYCDFTNYSNRHRTPDAAMALYWEGMAVPGHGGTLLAEVLYGVGDFDLDLQDRGLGITANFESRPTLNSPGTGYKDHGEFDLSVTVDNSVDGSKPLKDITVSAVTEDGVICDTLPYEYTQLAKGDIKDLTFRFTAQTQKQIVAKGISIGITALAVEGHTETPVTYSTDLAVLLPGTGSVSPITITEVAPETVYTSGTKSITLAGNLKAFQALDPAASANWDLYLVHENGSEVRIQKGTIAFLDDGYTTMTCSTNAELLVGEYSVQFRFTDEGVAGGLQASFGKSITAAQKLTVSNDPKYKVRTYGLMTLVRSGSNYEFKAFDTEIQFKDYEAGLTGDKEVLLVVRGAIKEVKDQTTQKTLYYTASHADGDITINEILTYVGESPLIMKVDGEQCSVSGDGLIKVIDSIDVWASKWSFAVSTNAKYSLENRSEDGYAPVTLEMGGVGYMLQAVAGFLIDMKFGELTVEENDAGNDVAYGISFGGSISLPIAIPSKKTPTSDTAADTENDLRQTDTQDDDDYGDSMRDLFNEGDDDGFLNSDDEDSTPPSNSVTLSAETSGDATSGDSAQATNSGTKMPMGTLSAEIEDLIYGQDPDDMSVGFVGIDTTFDVELPEDLLGSFITNAAGVSGSVTINTIEQYYAVEAALSMQTISCEGRLAFKQTEVGGRDVVVPDNIQFYIRDGLQIPLPPPGPLFLTGMGGGVDNLADTIGGEFTTLPPLTILLGVNVEVVEVLGGQLDASISASGLTLVGSLGLKLGNKSPDTPEDTGGSEAGQGDASGGDAAMTPEISTVPASPTLPKLSLDSGIDITAVMKAQWVDPIEITATGTVSVVGGLLSGTLSLVIAEDFFGGYASVSLSVPDDIPLVGGINLAQVEAAVSTQCIGAKVSVIGIGYGVLYYWDGDYRFGSDVEIAPMRARRMGPTTQILYDDHGDATYASYGANITPLMSTPLEPVDVMAPPMGARAPVLVTTPTKAVSATLTGSAGSDALLIAVPFEASIKPTAVTLNGPNGGVALVPDDGKGGGNYLVQLFSDGSGCMYFTMTDSNQELDGIWTVSATTELGTLTLDTMSFSAVSNISDVTDVTASVTDFNLDVTATMDCASQSVGILDIYLTQDRDALTKIQSTDYQDGLGTKVGTVERNTISTTEVERITLPDGLPSGDYYVVSTLTVQTGGMSTAISTAPVSFVNPNLPADVQSVDLRYAGDGEIFVDITDVTHMDYTHYMVELLTAQGDSTGIVQQFAVGDHIYMGKATTMSTFTVDEEGNTTSSPLEIPGVQAGQSYKALVKTLRKATKTDANGKEIHEFYYGSGQVISTEPLTIPIYDPPQLIDVESNISGGGTVIGETLELTYTFDRPVWMVWTANKMEESARQFAAQWKISCPLVDGDYVIDFTAMGLNKDTCTAADFEDTFPQLGFSVDTQPPVLSLVQKRLEDVIPVVTDPMQVSLMSDATQSDFVVATNLIQPDQDGKYTIYGLTEQDATLTVNGTQVIPQADGAFAFDGDLGSQSMVELVLVATDKAGNTATLTAYAVNTTMADVATLTLYRRLADGTLTQVEDNHLAISPYEAVTFVACTVKEDKIVELEPLSVDWNLVYEKNLVTLSDGTLTAGSTLGETALRVSKSVGTFVNEQGVLTAAYLEDYVVITIAESDKTALNKLIFESGESLSDPQNATAEEIATFQAAIQVAKAVSQDAAATKSQIADAQVALQKALDVFNAAKASGSGSSSSNRHKITLLPTSNGSLETSHSKVPTGTSVTFTAIPAPGYEVAGIYVNGIFYTNGMVLTLASVADDLTVEAVFAPQWNIPFEDVQTHDWFYDSVRFAYQNGYMNGIGDACFAPNAHLTRGMMVTILGRMMGADVADVTCDFIDVAAGMYYTPYVNWAVEVGMTNGTGENRFAPDREITREELSAMVYRLIQYLGGGFQKNQGYTMSFVDANAVSPWAQEDLSYLAMHQVIVGKQGDFCDPRGLSTRAEIATVLQRLLRVLGQEKLTF